MGTEVAARPPLPPGLTLPGSNSQGPGKKKRERERSFSSLGRIGSSSSSRSGRPIYSRDYHLRIQGQKYSLSSAIVCIGAKIHSRFTPSPPTLSRRGLSKVTLGEHPTTSLDFVEQPSVPAEFSHQVTEAIINSYRETPSSSNRSSPTITEEIPSSSPSVVHGDLWGTGNTTERSSVDSQYSWDEYDKQTAKQVQHFFDEIDALLYEKRKNQAEYIYNECQEWGSQFPHLRLLGRQILPVLETGYEMIHRDMSRPNTTSSMGLLDITDQDLSGSQDSQGLSVSGRSVQAIIPPVEARSRNSGTPSTQASEYSYLEEEVFESEGEYEEIIAVDFRDIYEDTSDSKKQLTPRRRRFDYPPITPNACLKDTVASSAFDCLWQEIISWIKPLLQRYTIVVLDENKHTPHQALTIHDHLASTPGPPSRENSMNLAKLPFGRSNTSGNMMDKRHAETLKLDGVLNISKKVPIQREGSHIHILDASESQLVQQRPGTSIPISGNLRPNSVRYTQSRGIKIAGIRLNPIAHDRSKTPSVDEERIPSHPVHPASSALLVRKINPPGAMGRISSPPYNARNGALPPIGTPVVDMDPHRYQKKMVSSRASSAVDKDLRMGNKTFLTTQDTRPSTTHAFRSETPQGRRASTPFNSQFNNLLSRSSAYGPGGKSLDIRGNGLQPSHDLGHLSNIPQEILEDHEGLDDHIHQNQWTPSTPSHNNPYYNNKIMNKKRQNSSLVRS